MSQACRWSGLGVRCVHVSEGEPMAGAGYQWDQGSSGQLPVTSVCACVCIRVSVNYVSIPAAGVGLWTSGVCMSRCQELGRLGSRGQVLPKASCWRDTHCTYIQMYTYIYFTLMDLLPDQPDRATGWGHWVCVSVLSFSVCAELCAQLPMYVLYMCGFVCVCAYWESTHSPGVQSWDSLTSVRLLDFIHTEAANNLHLFYFRNGTWSKKLYFLSGFLLNHYCSCWRFCQPSFWCEVSAAFTNNNINTVLTLQSMS